MFARLRARIAQMLLPSSHVVLPVPEGYRLVPYNPTKLMLKAAGAAMSPGRRPTQAWVSVRKKHGIRYRAMLDAYDRHPTKYHRRFVAQPDGPIEEKTG